MRKNNADKMDKRILEIEDIKKILPQRYPFLMLDRVIEASPEKVIAIKNVSINEEYFKGHFPEEEVMPGVLIIEAIAQAGIVLFNNLKPSNKRRIYFLAGVNKARFFDPVKPGVQLKIEVKPVKIVSDMGIISGEAFVADKKMAQAEISFGIREVEP